MTENKKIIRVVEGGGGQGIRRGNLVNGRLVNGRVVNFQLMEDSPASPEEIVDFIYSDLLDGTVGVAITMAGKISDHNLVVKSPNLHVLDDYNLGAEVTKKCGLPCFVGNDMETATAGEIALRPD